MCVFFRVCFEVHRLWKWLWQPSRSTSWEFCFYTRLMQQNDTQACNHTDGPSCVFCVCLSVWLTSGALWTSARLSLCMHDSCHCDMFHKGRRRKFIHDKLLTLNTTNTFYIDWSLSISQLFFLMHFSDKKKWLNPALCRSSADFNNFVIMNKWVNAVSALRWRTQLKYT